MLIDSRSWRLALVALAGTLAVALVMTALFHYVALENLKEMRAQQSVDLAHSLSTTIVDEVRGLRDIAATHSWAEMQESVAIQQFATSIEAKVRNLPIYRVNIFAPDGLTLYSTQTANIGSKVVMNAGIEIAAAGQDVSAIVRKDSFNAFDRVVEPHDMIETYVPLFSEGGQVIGVFEIHSDISEFFSEYTRTQTIMVLGVSLTIVLLYTLLVTSFWKWDPNLFARSRHRSGPRTGKAVSENVSKAKSEFVATVSHEMRTPLNAVLGMTDLINLTSLTRKQREYIQTIQSSGDMLISLVDNLLDFSHLEAGELKLHNSEFDVMDLLERVLHILGHSAYTKGLELVGNLQHDLGLRVSADKRRLQQILVNVVSNAIKFTDEGEVVVDVESVDGGGETLNLRISVTDTGSGIDQKTREHLFAAFTSGARPASSQPYGSGLGLTISKRLLDTMGGNIDIEASESGGTKVIIEAPVVRAISSNTDGLDERRTDWPQRVLSIQSNRSAARSICDLLQNWGMKCEAFLDVEEGIHRLRVAASAGNPFECVILDSALTSTDRLLAARRIRNSPEISDLPIVLLVPISDPLGIGEVTALGRLRCVNKPVLPLELRYNLLRSVRDTDSLENEESAAVVPTAGDDDFRILVAEDNPVSSGVLQTMLQAEGYGADVVDNGPAVLEALQDRRYDLLLLDCQMPGMDGDVATREIRRNPDIYGGTPVIVAVTANTTEEHRAQCLAAGMDDFVTKPLRLEGLRRGLIRWIAMAASRGEDDQQVDMAELRQDLIQRTGYDDHSFLNNYIGLFLQDTRVRLERLNKAIIDGGLDNVGREGHALKGACLELGADRMARFCDDLSTAAANENVAELADVIGKLDREFERLRPVYESVQESSTSPI